MLHDELKDINPDLKISFYEEDETDILARQKGKWVICRMITKDQADEEAFFFELHTTNGEKLLTSEDFSTYNGALRGIETYKTNILSNHFRIVPSKKGDYVFKLLSGKNLLLCMSETFTTKTRCQNAIKAVRRFAKTAIIDENIQDQVVKVPVEDAKPLPPLGACKGKWIIDRNVDKDGEEVYFFELYTNSGERLLSSEEYATYIGAVNGIQTHKDNIKKGNFRVSLTMQGDYIYKLLNSNKQLLCLGERCRTKQRCLNAVELVKSFAMHSPILTNPDFIK